MHRLVASCGRPDAQQHLALIPTAASSPPRRIPTYTCVCVCIGRYAPGDAATVTRSACVPIGTCLKPRQGFDTACNILPRRACSHTSSPLTATLNIPTGPRGHVAEQNGATVVGKRWQAGAPAGRLRAGHEARCPGQGACSRGACRHRPWRPRACIPRARATWHGHRRDTSEPHALQARCRRWPAPPAQAKDQAKHPLGRARDMLGAWCMDTSTNTYL